MTSANQQKVLDYIRDKNTSPLYFGEILFQTPESYEVTMDKLLEEKDFDTLVHLVVKRTWFSESLVDDEIVDTPPSKRRSSLDIWRHVKFFRPDTTIFQVMQSLIKNTEKYYNCIFCDNVWRRVFVDYPLFSTASNEYRHFGDSTKSEYGVYYEDWKTIAEES